MSTIAPPAARAFAGRRVAVTGAAGFIGGSTVRALARGGAEVIGIDVAGGERVGAAGAKFRRGDVTDPAAVLAALEGVELLVHAAAHVREWGSMEEFVSVNVGGTAAVLDAARTVGAERMVHISSVVVYGYDDPSEQDEAAYRRACGIPYVDTKSASDRIACRRGAVVVRPGDVYGPGGPQWVLRPVEMAKSGRLAAPGSGDGLMLPVYIDDLVEAILIALERGEPGQAYTAWDGEPVSFDEYFGLIAAIAGRDGVRHLPRPLLRLVGAGMEAWSRLLGRDPTFTARAVTFVDRRGTASNARMRGLGWEPRVPLEEGIRRTERWLRAEGLA